MAKLDVNALVKQAEAAGEAKTVKPAPAPKLAKGQWTDQVINLFGIDKTLPSGFVTVVYNPDGAQDGYIKNGKVMPLQLVEEGEPLPSAPKPNAKAASNAPSNQASVASFQYAQHLQSVAENEYNDLKVKAEIISRGGASAQDKQDLEYAAKQYQSTITAIQAAYEKSGAVQGTVNLDVTGKLSSGSTYIDPAKPNEGPKTATPKGVIPTIPVTGPTAADMAASQNAPTATPPAAPKSQTTSDNIPAASQSQLATSPLTPVTPDTSGNVYANPAGPKSIDQEKQDFATQYGGIGAMALATPWMADLLTQAVQGNWSATKFSDEIKNYVDPKTGAKPWEAISQSIRDSDLAYYGNKQAWAQQYNDKLQTLQDSAHRQGLDPAVFGAAIDLNNPAAIDAAFKNSSSGVNTFFSQYYNNIPDQAILDKYVANHATIATTNVGGVMTPEGQIAADAQSLRSYAASMGVASQYLTPTWSSASGSVNQGTDYFTNAAAAKAQGLTTLESEQALYRQQAASIYKPFAQQIQNGYSVSQLASPYTSAVANLLEVDPTSVNLGATTGYGAMVTKALQGDGTNPTSLDQFTTQVKQNPAWLQTTNARNSLMDTANQLLHSFGLVVG